MGSSKKTLKLDRANRKFLGVCAGLANYLEVEAISVRVVFLACCIFGFWFLVPLYFVAWFMLDESAEDVHSAITDNPMVKHFKTVDYRKKLYKNTRDGKFLGVCAGIADYLEINVFAVRMCFLVSCFVPFTGGFSLLFYFGAAMVLDKKPPSAYEAEALRPPMGEETAGASPGKAREWAQGFATQDAPGDQFSKRREFRYCARKFSTLQTRLVRIEAWVTSSRFQLHREFKNIS